MTEPATKQDLSEALRQFVARVMDMIHGRLDLLKIEVGDERKRLARLLREGMVALLTIFLALQLLALLIAAAVWDTPWRLPVIGGCAAAAMLVAYRLIHNVVNRPASAMFASSADELAKDRKVLDSLQ